MKGKHYIHGKAEHMDVVQRIISIKEAGLNFYLGQVSRYRVAYVRVVRRAGLFRVGFGLEIDKMSDLIRVLLPSVLAV